MNCLFFGTSLAPSPMYAGIVTTHLNLPVSLPHPRFCFRNPPPIFNWRLRHDIFIRPKCTSDFQIGVRGSHHWEKWIPRNIFAPEKLLGAIAGATSSPIAQYISSPTTFLHRVDPRIKMVWLFALVVLPAKSDMVIRIGVVIYLALFSVLVQPSEVWKDELRRVSLLCGVLFLVLGFSSDSAPSLLCSRSPPSCVSGLPNLPASFEGYKYVIMKFGPFQLTRKSLAASTTATCLTFTVSMQRCIIPHALHSVLFCVLKIIQSASLCLTTTTPEQLAFGLRWFILPLTNVGVPVAEIILTLLLSLRFINLVFDEVRNVALAVKSRRIEWQQLTKLETIDVFFTYLVRIFKNIYSHADQITQAMIVRGFRGDCESHQVLLYAGPFNKMANTVFVVSSLVLALVTVGLHRA